MQTVSSLRLFAAVALALYEGYAAPVSRLRGAVGSFNNTARALDSVAEPHIDSVALPSWQRGSIVNLSGLGDTKASVVPCHDITFIGAGIGSAYLINKIRTEHPQGTHLSIKLFERGDYIGGRLLMDGMSHPYWAGPPIEYGGMRVNPLVHKRVARAAERVSKDLYHKDCDMTLCKNNAPCCENMLAPMQVSEIVYRMTGDQYGKFLHEQTMQSWTVYDVHEVARDFPHAFGPAKRATQVGAWRQCLTIAPVTFDFFNNHNMTIPGSFGDAVDKACSLTAERYVIDANMTYVCETFQNPAAALFSCIGYDDDPYGDSMSLVLGFMNEVLNISGSTDLYLFRRGYQQLVKDMLLTHDGSKGVVPQLSKRLVEIRIGRGEDGLSRARELATAQASRFDQNTRDIAACKDAASPAEKIGLVFEDGSVFYTKALYLTPLPVDLVKIRGLEPWLSNIQNTTSVDMGTKLGAGWTNFSLSKALGLKPCWPGPCGRIIADGDDEWLTRQVWLWNDNTILIYGNAAALPAGRNQPSQRLAKLFNEEGIGAVVERIVVELRLISGQEIPVPDWAQLKVWPDGSLLPDWINLDTKQQSDYSKLLSRPLGPNVPVFYGNSEMSTTGDLHTWAEGAFEAADTVWDDLSSVLSSWEDEHGSNSI